MSKKISFIGSVIATLAMLIALTPSLVSAQTTYGQYGRGTRTPPAATGTVASVSGNSITLTGANGTTYTVDATNATISKFANNARTTIQVSAIANGDTLTVFGTATGANITATMIVDGTMPTFNGRSSRTNHTGTTTTPKPQKITTTGTVASISGTSITVNGANSTTYTVDASMAKFRRKANTAMLITDIQTGDTVKVTGTVSGTNITATIVQDTSMGAQNNHTTGTIAAVNGASFTVTTKANVTFTVNTTSTTVIEKFIGNSKQTASLSDLAVGENMLITGAVDSANNTIAASIVRIEMTRTTMSGTVQSVSGDTINFTNKKGQSFSFDASSAKLMRRYGAAIVDPSSLQNGDMLSVMGIMNGNAGFTAQTIRDNSLQARNGTFSGSVTAVNGASFTLQSKNRGAQTINTTSTTVFKQGKTTVTLATVAVGQTVTVTGVWDRTNSNVTATKVTIKQ